MRYVILFSAVLMQMCLGATYSWSIFVQPLKLLTGLQQGPVQIPFTVFYFTFPATVIFSGALLARLGPRRAAMLGGLLFGTGWLCGSLGAKSFWFCVVGIGLLSGIGAGIAYLVPITVGIRWFPNNKGLVAGVAVAGFGGGAALISQLGGHLLTSTGYSPFMVFRLFGGLFVAVTAVAGFFMHFPHGIQAAVFPRPCRPGTIISQPVFKLLYLAMGIGLAAGFTINANLKELFHPHSGDIQTGITAVSLFALANGAGRICWGQLFDKIAPTTAIALNLVLQAVLLFLAPPLLSSAGGFLMLACCSGFNYGGILVLYISTVSYYWGPDRVGKIYGWMFSANIPAAFTPIVAGIAYDAGGSFLPILYMLGGLLVATSVIILRNRSLIDSCEPLQSGSGSNPLACNRAKTR